MRARIFALLALLPMLLLAMCVADGPAQSAVPLGINFTAVTSQGWQPSDDGAFDYYQSKGMLAWCDIRVTAEELQSSPGAALNSDKINFIAARVPMCEQRGGKAIVNVQNFGSVGGQPMCSAGYTGRTYADLWLKIIKALPTVTPEIMNEPAGVAPMQVVACEQAVVTTLRWTGYKGPIIVSMPDWSNAATFARGSSAFTLLLHLYDPLKNLWVEYHVYFDAWSQGQGGAVDTAWIDDVQAVIDWHRAHPGAVAGWAITEFATTPTQNATLQAFLDKINGADDVFKLACWWGTAGTNTGRVADPYRLDTRTAPWDDQAAPADRGRPWSYRPEQPQMSVLGR